MNDFDLDVSRLNRSKIEVDFWCGLWYTIIVKGRGRNKVASSVRKGRANHPRKKCKKTS